MFKFLGGIVAGAGTLFGSLFGHHASTTPQAIPAHHAQEVRTASSTRPVTGKPFMAMGVLGKVSAINGDILTVTSQRKTTASSTAMSPVTFTVDATNAKVYKGSASTTVSISSVLVGDRVLIQGTVNDTSITATVVRDGLPMMGAMKGRKPMMGSKMK